MKSLHILSAKSDDLGEFHLRIVLELLTLALKSCFEDGDGSFETDHWWWEGALWAEARWRGILTWALPHPTGAAAGGGGGAAVFVGQLVVEPSPYVSGHPGIAESTKPV